MIPKRVPLNPYPDRHWATHVGYTVGLGWIVDGLPVYEWRYPNEGPPIYPVVRGILNGGKLRRTEEALAGWLFDGPTPRISNGPPPEPWETPSTIPQGTPPPPLLPRPDEPVVALPPDEDTTGEHQGWEWSEAKYHAFLGLVEDMLRHRVEQDEALRALTARVDALAQRVP